MSHGLFVCLPRILQALALLSISTVTAAQGSNIDSLADVPRVQQQIERERQSGNAETAWDLELELIQLAAQFPNAVPSARILQAVGEHRMELLARYDAGEFPEELVLGCFFNNSSQMNDASRRGSTPISASEGDIISSNSCATGSRRIARQAIAGQALTYFAEAARVTLRARDASPEIVSEVIAQVVATSHRSSNYSMGRWALDSLLEYQQERSQSAFAQAQTLASMGDWDMEFAQHFGKRFSDTAITLYEQALALMRENGVSQNEIDSLFSPAVPIQLPTFVNHGLSPESSSSSAGYVDIEFEIRDDGRSTSIDVAGTSADAPKAAVRDIENSIRHGRFRPYAANGQIVDDAPVSVRYYFEN